jgi:glyoxylase-like metal-dependent hydrolase (beta-lactamase superfamily II)/ferredoxin
MARFENKVPENVLGEFFVDATCINCDTCRQLAPSTFGEAEGHSFVLSQPRTGEEIRATSRALLACPTGSIGTLHPFRASEIMEDFPWPIEDGVFYCGFNSPKSFGGNSYFIRHPDGNWLVDSPKFLPHLIRRFEQAGGVKYIFLTHRDDVAEAEKYAQKFGAQRIIHQEDRSAQPGAEIILQGADPWEKSGGFLALPTPGHTRGHCVLLYNGKYLFTGDHLWWRRKRRQLGASRDVAWYSWRRQTESMERLSRFDFEWVLPGHGQAVRLDPSHMRREMAALVARMKASLEGGWES